MQTKPSFKKRGSSLNEEILRTDMVLYRSENYYCDRRKEFGNIQTEGLQKKENKL
jgi:hypothetical protein